MYEVAIVVMVGSAGKLQCRQYRSVVCELYNNMYLVLKRRGFGPYNI
jgi:hypothetical protein